MNPHHLMEAARGIRPRTAHAGEASPGCRHGVLCDVPLRIGGRPVHRQRARPGMASDPPGAEARQGQKRVGKGGSSLRKFAISPERSS